MEGEWKANGGVAPRANGTAAAQRSPLARWRGAGAAWVAGETQNAPTATAGAFWNIQRTGLIGDVGHVVRVGHDSRADEQ